MRITNQKDFLAGGMFIGFGAFFAGFGTQYTFGSAASMGPAYFPTILGIMLMGLGLIVSIGALSAKATEEKVNRFAWPTLLLVLGPVFLFGLLFQTLGLVLSLFMLVVISSYASHEFRWKEALLNSVLLITLSLLVFVYALKLQFQLLPSFIGG